MTRFSVFLIQFLAVLAFLVPDLPESAQAAAITAVAKRPYRTTLSKYSSSSRQRHSAGKRLTVSAKQRPASTWQTKRSSAAVLSTSKLRRKLSSRSAIVMDSETGQVLYSHDPDRPAQPASTIKVLTGLIAMKSLRDATRVEVSHKASRMPRSKIYIRKGKRYAADDLINAVLLSSANDASVALAEKVAGSERTFAKLMTHKAKLLGARSTLCKTATGLTSRGQRSTARDLATIFNNAMRDPEFSRRIRKSRVRTRYGGTLSNHNKALWQIKGAIGGKTGYTHAARQTYVGKFVRGDDAITVAIMGSETMWDDISRLVEHGFARKRVLAKAEEQKHDSMRAQVKGMALARAEQARSLTRPVTRLTSKPFVSTPAILSSSYKRAIF